jgi:hypothetical protein
MQTRALRWFLTINNFVLDEQRRAYNNIENQPRAMMVHEIGHETGTPHLHIFVEYRSPKSFQQMRRIFPRANIQPAQGTTAQIRQYLDKGGIILYEIRMQDRRQGFMEAANIDEFRDLHPREFLSHLNNAITIFNNIFLEDHSFFDRKQIKTYWFYGHTGSGKTWAACDALREIHEEGHQVSEIGLCRTELWFNGIDYNTYGVLIDDFRASSLQYHKLLRLLDGRPLRVEIKGSFTIWNPSVVFITCSLSPHLCYSGINALDGIEQLLRRLTEIRDFSEDPYFKVLESILTLN